MVSFVRKSSYTFDDLIAILRILRAPDGCPWDHVQTHASNRRNFLEEAYEAAEAFDRDDPELMCEEPGDMLMQVLFNIHIEEDAGRFTFADVTDRICKKLIFRHPHLFTEDGTLPEDTVAAWDELKRQEKGFATLADELDAVAHSLPALWRAEKVLKKAGRAGFAPQIAQEDEPLTRLGDTLLADVARCREAGVDPEEALHRACDRFLSAVRAQETSE